MEEKDRLAEAKKLVLVFPGQGSQYQQMGLWLLERDENYKKYLDVSSNIVGRSLLDIIYGEAHGTNYGKIHSNHGNNNAGSRNIAPLELTEFAQISIFTLECATYDFLINRLGLKKENIFAVIGHSLGEYGALYAAGVFDYENGAKLVAYRGSIMNAMNSSDTESKGMMAAVIGETLDLDLIREVIYDVAPYKVFIANYNDYSQIVLSGYEFELEKVIAKLSELKKGGIRKIIPLKVNVASHCPLMSGVAQKLDKFIEENVSFSDPVLPFFSTIEVSFIDKRNIKRILVDQLTKPIRWVESVEYFLKQGAEIFIEVGPAKVLSNLIKRIASRNGNDNIKVFSTDKWEDIENLRCVFA